MTYTELTCDDIELSLEDLYEGSLRKMPDGSFSQQVVIVTTTPPDHPYPYKVGETLASGATGNATLAIPAGDVGDLLVMFLGLDVSPTLPSGWTEVTTMTFGADSQLAKLWTRVADGTEGASVTVTLGSNSWSIILRRYTNTDGVDAFKNAQSYTPSGTSPASTHNAGVTTSEDNCTLVLMLAGDLLDGATPTTLNTPSGYGNTSDISAPQYSDAHMCDKVQAVAGASGVVAASIALAGGTCEGVASILLSLKPKAGTPPPDPPAGSIAPADVTIVANSDDAESADMATDYANAYGIPLGNIITMALGGTLATPTCGYSASVALHSEVEAAGRQFTQLCMRFPSRTVSLQSITSLVTFGWRATTDLTVSELYNTSSLTPYTDHGRRPCAILLSSAYRKDGVVLNSGTSYMHLAKDGAGNLRGNARAAQTAAGLSVYDARSVSGIASGNNDCNQIGSTCAVGGYPTYGPIAAAYESIYLLGSSGTVVWNNGFYGDHLTSYGGVLPDGNGGEQTPLTYHLDHGASFSCGTVQEPYQDHGGNSPGSLVEQFVNVSVFDPLFRANVPVGIAAWAAVKCPDRTLFAGDLMFQAQF